MRISIVAVVVLVAEPVGHAQPAGIRQLTAPDQPSDHKLAEPSDAVTEEEDRGTLVYLLGDATFNVTDVKNVNAVGLGIRGPELWLRLFVSNATEAKISADPGDASFGRAVLNSEIGGFGASLMARYLPIGVQDRPSTRLGVVLDLAGQTMSWQSGDVSGDGLAGGANLGISILAESNLTPPNDANGVLAYADLLLMVRGLNRDLSSDLRQSALGTTDRKFGGFGVRAGAKINQLTFAATYSWFPTDHNVKGLTGGQISVTIGVDSGLELQWAPPKQHKPSSTKPTDREKVDTPSAPKEQKAAPTATTPASGPSTPQK